MTVYNIPRQLFQFQSIFAPFFLLVLNFCSIFCIVFGLPILLCCPIMYFYVPSSV